MFLLNSNETDKLAIFLEENKWLKQNEKIVEISKEQYHAGSITQLDLLVAQQNQLDSENNLAISEASVAQNAVALYESLGILE